MTGPRPAAIAAFVFVLLLLVSTVGFHYWAVAHVPPIQDAANLVARASSRALELQHLRLREHVAFLRMDVNNLLSVVYFSLFSLVAGPGRIAWGWGWAVAVAAFFLAAAAAESHHAEERPLLATVLLFACGPLVFRPGGLLDQRFDPFAVLIVCAAAFALVADRPLAAAWLSLAAALAKGAALPVMALTWLAAMATGVTPLDRLGRAVRSRPWLWAGLAVAALAYGWFCLRDVVAYNLSAVSSPTPEGQAGRFLLTAPRLAWGARWFYPAALTRHAPLSWLLVAGGLVLLLRAAREGDAVTRRRAAFGLVLFVLLDLLFSATPPPAAVLVVWLAPAVFVLGLAAAPSLGRRAVLIPALGVLSLAFQLYRHSVGGAGMSAEAAAALPALHAHADALADALEARALSGRRVLVSANFLYSPLPDLAFNCDVERVLLYERLGRAAPVLDGWTLGSWSDDWRAEMPVAGEEALLTVLAVGARDGVHHRGRAGAMGAQFMAVANPACAVPVPGTLGRPELGHIRAFLTAPDLQACR